MYFLVVSIVYTGCAKKHTNARQIALKWPKAAINRAYLHFGMVLVCGVATKHI